MGSNNPPASERAKTPDSTPPLDVALFMRLLPLLAIAAGLTLASLLIVELFGGVERFRTIIESAGPWAPLAYVLLKASTYVIAPLSGTPVKLASGVLFGVWEGMALSLAGDTLGGSLNYWIARTLGRKGIAAFAGKKAIRQVEETTDRVGGWRALLGARLLLSSLYDFVSYAAGLARISFKQYFVITLLGGIPPTIFFAAVGDAAVSSSLGIYIMAAICAFLLIATGALYLSRKKSQKM
ncbi:MAG TPA: TVP38/TMEM64 family protein [Candidatus Saccharimonadales bacterium]|nr:TVP38/TMEM64 family protein [Candidatus Saccharimonadales bacterium]